MTGEVLGEHAIGTIEPSAISMFDNDYAEPHSLVDEERRHEPYEREDNAMSAAIAAGCGM